MQPQKDLAIILKSIPYEERHKVVTALTEQNGQITAMARNSIQSRRFGGALDLFAASDWIFTQRPGAELCSVTQANIRRSFEGLTSDFEKLALASVFNELMLKVAPRHEACQDLFKLHSNALSILNDLPEKDFEGDLKPKLIVVLLNSYLAKLLQWSGNQPRLYSCLQCGIELEQLSMDVELSCIVADAGWLCPGCRHEGTRHVRDRGGQAFQHSLLRLTPLAVRDFQLSLSIPIRQVSERCEASLQEHQDLFRFLEGLTVFHLPGFDQKPLRSLRFLGLKSSLPPEPESHR